MPTETELSKVPPIPSFWRLMWMLFLQPLPFHALFQRWDFDDPSLYKALRRLVGGDPLARRFLACAAVWLFGVMPMAAALLAGAGHVFGAGTPWRSVAGAVAGGLAGCGAVCLLSVRTGVRFGVAFSMAASVAFLLGGGTSTVTPGAVTWLIISLVLGGGLALTAFILGKYEQVSTWQKAKTAMRLGLANSFVFGALSFLMFQVAFTIAGRGLGGIGVTMVSAIAFKPLINEERGDLFLFYFSLFVFGVGAIFRSEAVFAIGMTIFFINLLRPAPGLQSFLIQAVREDQDLGRALFAEALTSLATLGATSATLADLLANELEQVARERLFGRAANLDFTFLFEDKKLPYDSPISIFQMAARELATAGLGHRRRREALKRARDMIEDFRERSGARGEKDPLRRRLHKTARVWTDVLDEEGRKLAVEEAERPEVPTVFVAGAPLNPEREEDRTLFNGRDDLAKVIEHDLAPDRRGVLVVFGQRRMGKTSLSRWLPHFLGMGTLVVPVDFQLLSGYRHRETPHRWIIEAIAVAVSRSAPAAESARWGEDLRWLEEIDRSLDDRRVLVVIDEVERVQDGIRDGWCSTDVLDFIRAAGDSLSRVRFLLLTAYPLHRLGPHWVDRLVSATSRTISYLDEPDARELILKPVPDFPDIYPEGGVERILRETGRHPFLIQKVCDELCRLLNKRGGRRRATDDELTEVFDIVVNGADLFDELWRQRTEDEKSALRRLANASEPMDLPTPAARQLVREGYLTKRAEQVEITVLLFRAWIAERHGGE